MEFSSRIDDLMSRLKSDLKPVPVGRFIVAFARNERAVNERLTFQCEATSLPGMSFTEDDYEIGSRTIKKMATHRTFANEITLKFRISPDMKERVFFEEWMNRIFDPVTNTLAFHKTYVDDMSIVVQDSDDKPIYGVVFEELYPTEITPISLESQGKGYLVQDIKFSYYRWKNAEYIHNNTEFTGSNLDSLNRQSSLPWESPLQAKADAGRVILVPENEYDDSTRPWRNNSNNTQQGTLMSGHQGEIDSGGRIANDGGILPGGNDTFLA